MPYCPIHQTYQFCDCHKQRKTEPERTPEPALSLFEALPTKAPPSNGTRTSREAADSLTRRVLNGQHRAVLNALWTHGPLTDEEIQAHTGLSPSSERPRRGELVEDGDVIDTGQTRPTRSGRAAILWYLSAERREEAEQRRRARRSA